MKLFRYEKTLLDREVDGVRIQVFENGDTLEMRFGNYIVQSARSLTAPDVLALDYTRAMMAGLLFVPRPESILHFGLGGGTLPDFLHRNLASVRQLVVEKNPGVIEAAFRFFQLPISPRLQVVNQEGTGFLETHSGQFDLIFMDAYDADGADLRLNTDIYYQMLRRRLTPHGWLVNNVWGSDQNNLKRVRIMLNRVFPTVMNISVRADSNVIFFVGATNTPPSARMLKRRAQLLSQQFPLDFAIQAHRIRPLFVPIDSSGTATRAGG